jgi:Tol biopolymer transport system component
LLPKRQNLTRTAVTWQQLEESPEASIDTPGASERSLNVARKYIGRLPAEAALFAKHVGPLILLLAIFGVTRKPMFLLAALIAIPIYPLFTPRSDPRFVLPYVPLILFYAFVCAQALKAVRFKNIAYALLVVSAAVGIYLNRDQLTTPPGEGHYDLKAAGQTLATRVAPGAKVADRKPYLSFYMKGEYVKLPLGAYDGTMRQLDELDVDYLSLNLHSVQSLRPALLPLLVDREAILGEARWEQYFRFNAGTHMIYRRDRSADALDWRQVTSPAAGGDVAPVWSPDGERIAFEWTRSGNSDIYIVVGEDEPVALIDWPSEESFPAWSPDGQSVAFSSDRDGSEDIFAVEVESRSVEKITADDGFELAPWWSRDEIVFFSDRAGGVDVFSKKLSTGATVPLTHDGENTFPVVSPDGSRLAWVRPGKGLAVLDRSTGQIAIAERPRNVKFRPSWSANGEFIAVTAEDWGSNDVYLLTADLSAALLLTNGAGFDGVPSWAPDMDRIAVVSDRDGTMCIWIVSGVSGRSKRLSREAEVFVTRLPSR